MSGRRLQVELDWLDFRDFPFDRPAAIDLHGVRAVTVVPVFEGQRDAGEDDAQEDHHEDAADVVDADAVALAVLRVAVLSLRVPLPPFVLQLLQSPLVQQYQDPEEIEKQRSVRVCNRSDSELDRSPRMPYSCSELIFILTCKFKNLLSLDFRFSHLEH